MICKDDITQDYLKSILSYSPETGTFIWNKQVSNVLAGSIAGHIKSFNGIPYIVIGIDNKTFLAHRLAWLYMTGSFPESQIDHINGSGIDNSWINIRDVNPATNAKNTKLSIRNKSGILGVRWAYGKWLAKIGINGESVQLYWGDDLFEACCMRKAAEYLHEFHENHGRPVNNGRLG